MTSYGCVITDGRYSCPGEPLIEKRLNLHAGHADLSPTTANQLNRLVTESKSLFDTASAMTLAAFYGIGKASAEPAFSAITRRFSNGARTNTSSYLGLGMMPVVDILSGLSVYLGEGDLSELGSLALDPIKNLAVAPERILAGEYAEGFYNAVVGLNVSIGLLYGSAVGAGTAVKTVGRIGSAVTSEIKNSAGAFADLIRARDLALAGGGRAASPLADVHCLQVAALKQVTQPIPETVPGYTPPPKSSPSSPMRTPGGSRIFPQHIELPKQTIFPKPFGTPADRAATLSAEAGTRVIVIESGEDLVKILERSTQGRQIRYVCVELDVPSVNGVRPREFRIAPSTDASFQHRRLLHFGERVVGAGNIQREFVGLVKFDGNSPDFPTTRLGVSDSSVSPFVHAHRSGIIEIGADLRAMINGQMHVYSDYL